MRSQSDYFMMDGGSRSGSVKQNRTKQNEAPLLSPKSVLGESEGHLGSVQELELDIYYNNDHSKDQNALYSLHEPAINGIRSPKQTKQAANPNT